MSRNRKRYIALKSHAYGLAATLVPRLNNMRFSYKGTGGSLSAEYCYSVWLRHMVNAFEHGLSHVPHTVAELGPGDSLGVGICALVLGTEKYVALDVQEYSTDERNLRLFEELVDLVRARARIPDDGVFPRLRPFLSDYSFPSGIFPDEDIERCLASTRLKQIRDALQGVDVQQDIISYAVPWTNVCEVDEASVDYLLSQAVLEHVDDLMETYGEMYRWMKPMGMMSHQIDMKSHGITVEWNGHWTKSDFLWRIIRGGRKYLINRAPCSAHIGYCERAGFKIKLKNCERRENKLSQERLAPRFRSLSREDLETSSIFFIAQKVAT